jgi:hypothetical protein
LPTKRTRREHRWAPGLSQWQIFELLTGKIRYPIRGYTGYGDGEGHDLRTFISDAMVHDWQQHRDGLLRFWISGRWSSDLAPLWSPWLFFRGAPGTRPWAFWELEDGEPVCDEESEAEYLTRCGLWLPGECELLERAGECIGERVAPQRRKP